MRPIVNMPEKNRVTDIGNMHKKFGKDRTHGSGDILSDRQTDTQTNALTPNFATALVVKVNMFIAISI